MTDLVQQLEQLRVRMNQQAQQEAHLLAQFGDVLRATDHQLLREIRTLTAEHEARRTAILCELQMLASRLDAVPIRAESAAPLPAAARGFLPSGVPANGEPSGDWEQRSALIREALNNHLSKGALAG